MHDRTLARLSSHIIGLSSHRHDPRNTGKLSQRRGAALCLLSLALLSTAPASALAQTSPRDKAAAEALFDRGLELMRQGKDKQACETLERSQAIEPGVGTMLYLAECYEKLGRTASAWAMYREAASAAQAQGQADRAKVGAARAEHLTPTLSKLTLNVPAEAAVAGLVISRNGSEVPAAAYGIALPVDPGEQQLSAAAPGYAPWSLNVQLPANGARVEIDVPPLAPLPQSEIAASGPGASADQAGQAAHPTPLTAANAPAPKSSFHKPLAYALGGVGLVALGLGSYFGARAISENNSATDLCTDGICRTQEGLDHDSAARSAATAANVLVVGGLAATTTALIVYLTRPRADELRVGVAAAPGFAQVSLAGGF